MKKKHTYRSVEIKQVEIATLLALLTTLVVFVAIDVAKHKQLVAFCTQDGTCRQLVRFDHPSETSQFLDLLGGLVQAGKTVQVVLEPTGTYGDVLMYQCDQRGLPVFLVNPKRTHDAAEFFDGVPSQHDGKDATLIGRLHEQGLSRRWEPKSEQNRALRALVSRRDLYAQMLERLQGQLEPLLVKHWPEIQSHLDFRSQRSALRMLGEFPSPKAVNENPEEVLQAMWETSRGRLSPEALQGVLDSAAQSLGVPLVAEEQALIKEISGELDRLLGKVREMDDLIREVLKGKPTLAPVMKMLGATTTAVLVSRLGDLTSYESVGALEKACGLNLCERSSGTYQGTVHITKRGPGLLRKYLFLAALRWVQWDPIAAAWYEKRSGYTEKSKMRAVIALMRKQLRALFHVSRGESYDASRLFDTKRLKPRVAKPRFVAQAGAEV